MRPRSSEHCLYFQHYRNGYLNTSSTTPFQKKAHHVDIRALRGKAIYRSQFGWLVLVDHTLDDPDCYSITLWNPDDTSKSIKLPPFTYHDLGDWRELCVLTSPPSDKNCFLFFCFSDQAFVCRCQPRRSNTSNTNKCGRDSSCQWYSKKIEIEGERAILQTAVAVNGVIYGCAKPLHDPRRVILVSIKIVEDDDDASNPFTITVLPLAFPGTCFTDLLAEAKPYMLVESCGSIYHVVVGTRNCDGAHAARIWELDLQQLIWVQVKCLGDRAFYLRCNECTWCWASTTDSSQPSQGVRGNCLYIYDEEITNAGVVLYSLEDCSSTLLPLGVSLNGAWDIRSVHWVMPHQWFGPESKKFIDNDVSTDCKQLLEPNKPLLLQPDKPQDRLSELPGDLIELLSRYMHLFDYWNFRCSSKMIQFSTPLHLWKTNKTFPLFLVFENDAECCRLVDICRDDSRSCIFRFSNDYFDIFFSKDEWLLVCDYKTLRFLNPFTRERGDLPLPRGWFKSIGFSTNPTCSKCLTVKISSTYDESKIIIEYLKFGDKEWSSCHFDNSQDPQFLSSFCSPVYHEGAFYWLDKAGHLGVFEMVDEETSWIVYDSPFSTVRKFYSCYLVKCGEKLLSVFIGSHGKYVVVFSFKQPEKKWANVQSLGNYTLFIRSNSSISVATRDTKMMNKIYLPVFQENDIVYYSLETKRYYVKDIETRNNDFFGKKIPTRCCWV